MDNEEDAAVSQKPKLKWHGVYCNVEDDRGRSASLERFGRGLYVITLHSTFRGLLSTVKKEAERLLKCSLQDGHGNE